MDCLIFLQFRMLLLEQLVLVKHRIFQSFCQILFLRMYVLFELFCNMHHNNQMIVHKFLILFFSLLLVRRLRFLNLRIILSSSCSLLLCIHSGFHQIYLNLNLPLHKRLCNMLQVHTRQHQVSILQRLLPFLCIFLWLLLVLLLLQHLFLLLRIPLERLFLIL